MLNNMPRVLVVEDGRLAAATLRIQLESLGYVVVGVFENGEEAVRKAPELLPDIALVDIMLSGVLDGVQTAAELSGCCDLPIIFITSSQEIETFERAKQVNPFGYLAKPVAVDTLHRSIEMAIHKNRLEQRLLESESRYRLIVESLNDGLAILGSDYSIRYCNSKLLTMLKKHIDDVVGGSFVNLLHPAKVSKFWLETRKAQSDGFASFGGNLRVSDDEYLPVRIGISSRTDVVESSERELVCVVTDVSELLASAAALREAEAKYRTIFENAREGIFQATPDGRFIELNPAMTRLFGFIDSASMLGEFPTLCQLFTSENAKGDLCLPFLTSQKSVHGFQLCLNNKQGGKLWVELSCHTVLDASGNVTRLEGMVIDVTARRLHELHLLKRATKDDLTGVNNRSAFREVLAKTITEVRGGEYLCALLYIDLNNFKKVNDRYGHHVGDKVLREVAGRLSLKIRNSDVIGRVGGDEFSVLLRGISCEEDARRLATNLLTSLHDPFDSLPDDSLLGMSIGVVLLGLDAPDHSVAMRRADAAMYHAKTMHLGVVLWEAGMYKDTGS
ncbi:diguanylate cyclase domain-containing protein [Oleidesulfovibrio sp.]|uniref:GGDEF domain-containing response regulator n=1 Tax=Oleidesulfovibrio sp. TaxID=2909707 RepID=UPI003A8A4431